MTTRTGIVPNSVGLRRALFGLLFLALVFGVGYAVTRAVASPPPSSAAGGAASTRAQAASPAPTGLLNSSPPAAGLPNPPDFAAYSDIVPAPVSSQALVGGYKLSAATIVHAPAGTSAADTAADAVATDLAALLRPATGYALPVQDDSGTGSGISLVLNATANSTLGTEGYQLATVNGGGVTLTANDAQGLYEGVQTLRQLLPPQIAASTAQSGVSWVVPAGNVTDYPRYAYRGAGLDVARHFFTVAQVEHFVDEISQYKINYLRIHLSDDQGWRIQINGYPNLTSIGGATEVGGAKGAFYYTQAQFQQIVAYAAAHYVTVIPEVDVPGHVTAALASYPALGCGPDEPTQVYTGISPPYTTLCASATTTKFISAVFSQLDALTQGPYVSIGGDEADATPAATFDSILTEAASTVRAGGKEPWGWQEDTSVPIAAPDVAGYWHTTAAPSSVVSATKAGTQLVLEPANHAYLDQKYNASSPLGLDWAGYVDVEQAYAWNPATLLAVSPSSILGVEGSLWTETIVTPANIDYMVFPRLPAIAEIGWSPESTHNWTSFKTRLAAQGPRWKIEGIDYYHSTEVPWPAGS